MNSRSKAFVQHVEEMNSQAKSRTCTGHLGWHTMSWTIMCGLRSCSHSREKMRVPGANMCADEVWQHHIGETDVQLCECEESV